MTQKNAPGYPLPSGELGNDEIACQLVFIPDRPEYWQAFIASYHYLSTWIAWERDADKRGKDAAANWREAFELTMECWRMACLEDLLEDVSAIRTILEGGFCCHEQDPTNGDQYTDEIEDGVGNVPQNIIDAGYATGTSDWDGFDDYKCMISHVVIDSMESKFRKLAPIVDTAAVVAGGIATITAIITAVWTGGLSLLVAGLLAAVGRVALFYESILPGAALETLADKIETNRSELVCAFYQSDGIEGAVEAVRDKIDELFSAGEALLLKNSGIDIDAKALYGGRYDQIDTAEALADLGYDVGDYNCSTCDEEEIDDETDDIWWDFDNGTAWSWNSSESCWQVTSTNYGGCQRVDIEWFSNAAKTVYYPVKFQLLSCTQSNTCASATHHRGFAYYAHTLVWSDNHPVDTEIHQEGTRYTAHVHSSVFTMKFRVFRTT